MTRALQLIVHNWPLKLAAIGLATLLYGGLVLSQNSYTLTAGPRSCRHHPRQYLLLTAPADVTTIRYFAPSDVPAPTASCSRPSST